MWLSLKLLSSSSKFDIFDQQPNLCVLLFPVASFSYLFCLQFYKFNFFFRLLAAHVLPLSRDLIICMCFFFLFNFFSVCVESHFDLQQERNNKEKKNNRYILQMCNVYKWVSDPTKNVRREMVTQNCTFWFVYTRIRDFGITRREWKWGRWLLLRWQPHKNYQIYYNFSSNLHEIPPKIIQFLPPLDAH